MHMGSGDTIMFYFERYGRGIGQRAEFVRRVTRAIAAAQSMQDMTADPTPPAAPAPKKPRLEGREQKGAELRKLLREVSHMRWQDRNQAARAKLEAAATGGKVAGKKTISNRAGEMADLLFIQSGRA